MPAQANVKSVRALVAQFSKADPVGTPTVSKAASSTLEVPKVEEASRTQKLPSNVPLAPSPFFSRNNSQATLAKRIPSYPLLTPTERRTKRYKAAEEALSASAKHANQEPSTLEQKIRALRQTTALLNYYAHEAQSDITRLRALLNERNVDEVVYEAARVKRWFQEKRRIHLLEEKCSIQAHMERASEPETLVLNREERNHHNLQRFITRDARVKTYAPIDLVRRVITKRNVSPMRLQTSAKTRRPAFIASSSQLSQTGQRRPHISQNSSYLFPSSTKYAMDDDNVSIRSGYNGRVTIFQPTTPKPAWNHDSIISKMEDVSIPSYARNLMDHFDEQSGAISLPLRRFSLGKRSKARYVPPSKPPTLPELHLLTPVDPDPVLQQSSSSVPMPSTTNTPDPSQMPSSPSKSSFRSRRRSKHSSRAETGFDSDRSVFDFFSSKTSSSPAKLTKRSKRRSFFSHDPSNKPSALALLISRPKAHRRPAQQPMGVSSRTSVTSNVSDFVPQVFPKTSLQIAPPTTEDDQLYQEAMTSVPPSPLSSPTKSRGRGLVKRLSVVDMSIFGGGGRGGSTSPKKEPRRAKSFRDLGMRKSLQTPAVQEE